MTLGTFSAFVNLRYKSVAEASCQAQTHEERDGGRTIHQCIARYLEEMTQTKCQPSTRTWDSSSSFHPPGYEDPKKKQGKITELSWITLVVGPPFGIIIPHNWYPMMIVDIHVLVCVCPKTLSDCSRCSSMRVITQLICHLISQHHMWPCILMASLCASAPVPKGHLFQDGNVWDKE